MINYPLRFHCPSVYGISIPGRWQQVATFISKIGQSAVFDEIKRGNLNPHLGFGIVVGV